MISFRKFVVAAALGGFTALASAAGYSGLYIFGDSLSDSGNLALAIGANPAQVITGNGYIPSQPYASGQFSNGDVWAKSFAASAPGAAIAAAAAAYAAATGGIVDQLQAAGAQHIVVWDVPNLGLAPAVTSLGAAASFVGGQVSLAMNGALAARMSTESGVSIFDIFGLQNAFAANPSFYGLANVADACGALPSCDPSTSLFWDGIHPTAAGHALIAQGMLATVAAVPEPATVALMLGGLVFVGWRARRGS